MLAKSPQTLKACRPIAYDPCTALLQSMHKLCKTFCINWQDGSRRYVRVEGAGSKWFPPPFCHPPLSANSLAKWVSNGGFNSNSSNSRGNLQWWKVFVTELHFLFFSFNNFKSLFWRYAKIITKLYMGHPNFLQYRENYQNLKLYCVISKSTAIVASIYKSKSIHLRYLLLPSPTKIFLRENIVFSSYAEMLLPVCSNSQY